MSKLTPDDRDKVGKIQQMMAKEKEANFTSNLEKEIKCKRFLKLGAARNLAIEKAKMKF